MTFQEILAAELAANDVRHCKGCADFEGSSHKRGFADVEGGRAIHYDSEIATRSTLFGALHEIGHVVTWRSTMRRWESEKAATDWALEVECPECHAPVGRWCRRPSEHRAPDLHAGRDRLAMSKGLLKKCSGKLRKGGKR